MFNEARVSSTSRDVILIHDSANSLSDIRNLSATDFINILAPVITPVSDNLDPFEHFGQVQASYHSKTRHLPCTNANGITTTHLPFISRAAGVIIFMSEATQIKAARVTQTLTSEKPLLVVLAGNSQNLLQPCMDFSAVIQCKDYSRTVLENVASFIFNKLPSRSVIAV